MKSNTSARRVSRRIGWVVIPIEGVPMQKINVAGLYYIGQTLHPLIELKQDLTYEEAWSALYDAKLGLDTVEAFNKGLNLSYSRSTYTQLKESVDKALANHKANPNDVLTSADYYALTIRTARFESVFAAEFEGIDTYAVAQIMAYNTRTLIEKGEEVIHETLRGHLPVKARKDLREATRCLAFQLHTAVGFHILRAVEATILEYFNLLSLTTPTKGSERNLGNYIKVLRDAGVEDRILLPLDQIRALHRNELMHPDRSLDGEESSSLFEVSKAALTAMLIDIKARTPPDEAEEAPDSSSTDAESAS